jgi:hypothetical protein
VLQIVFEYYVWRPSLGRASVPCKSRRYHSAARQQSMLCPSTTCRAHQESTWLYMWRGSREQRSVGRSRPQRNLLRHEGKKKNWRTATQDRAPARTPHPTQVCPGSESMRAWEGVPGVGPVGREGGRGRQSRMSGERHAVCARRVGVLRLKGVGRRVAAGGPGATRRRRPSGNGHKERISHENRC